MDPVSSLSAIISIVEVAFRTTSALIEYAKDTQNGFKDRKLLSEETQSLSKLLERLRDRARQGKIDDQWVTERKELIGLFQRAYHDLASALNIDPSTGLIRKASRCQSLRVAAKWSFAKNEVYSILERITRLHQYANTLLLDEQYSLVERLEQRELDSTIKKKRQSILNWLSPLPTEPPQTISSWPREGSGSWFLTSKEFIDWRVGKEQYLWCPGIPGAGKTVIASIVVENLRREKTEGLLTSEAGVAAVYLKYNDPEQTLEKIFGGVLKQLIQERSIIPSPIDTLYERCQDQNIIPTLQDLYNSLMGLIDSFSQIYLIIDALDESDDNVRWDLVEKLRSCGPKIRLMITSRNLESIEEELNGFTRLEIKANKADIELFIDQHIQKNKNLRRIVEKGPGMRADIKEAVVKTAEDMFLLARLHVESLISAAALSISHVRKKLRALPTTLVATYDEAMLRIEKQEPDHKEIALKTLAWVSYAFRSLSVAELQHALAIEPGHSFLDEELLMDEQSITELCAGLVICDSATGLVSLVHYTTKNYFENIRMTRFPGFHATITMSCATYLALPELKDSSVWKIARKYPLACYAAQYLGEHARKNPEETLEPSILQEICRLLSHPDRRKPLLSLLDGLNLTRGGFLDAQEEDEGIEDDELTLVEASLLELEVEDIIQNSNEWTKSRNTAPKMPEVTALHLAASMGLATVASMLLNDIPDVDAVDEGGKTALALAMERGFEKAVELLVNSGASIDLASEQGQAIFLLVIERDWINVADVIADKAKRSETYLGTANIQHTVRLVLAGFYGDRNELKHLLEQGLLDLKEKDSQAGATALFLAVEKHHVDFVQDLFDFGVGIESRDSSGQSALHRATRRGAEDMVSLLLKNGAEVDSKDDDGRTAWSAHARSRNYAVLSILLRNGADPNTKGHQGVSELYTACENGETELVRYMLESGTNPSIRTQFLWEPLHWASYFGHLECVKLLIQAGADLSPVSDQDATPLDLALRANQVPIIELLIRSGGKESRDITIPVHECEDENPNSTDGWGVPLDFSNTKIALTFDKPIQQGLDIGQFVYPSNIKAPKDYIYHLSGTVDTVAPLLSIRKAETRADMVEYPLHPDTFDHKEALFNISYTSQDYQKLILKPLQQSGFLGVVRMHRDWTGGWKVHNLLEDGSEIYLFRTTPDWSRSKDGGCRWSTEDGTLLARTGLDGITPVFTFEYGPHRSLQDLLVSCWVAKLWSETVAIHRWDSNSKT